jgi:hypothetical protein
LFLGYSSVAQPRRSFRFVFVCRIELQPVAEEVKQQQRAEAARAVAVA